MRLIYRSQMNNEQFIEDGMNLLNGKSNLTKLRIKLNEITRRATDDYAVDEMERQLMANGYEVLWNDDNKGYRII